MQKRFSNFGGHGDSFGKPLVENMVYHNTICQSYMFRIRTTDMKASMMNTDSTLQKIEKAPQTLRDIVQARLREAIIAGHFAPGERLVERPLCDQLGVSRTVIRETIRFLEAEGLVENNGYRWSQVSS